MSGLYGRERELSDLARLLARPELRVLSSTPHYRPVPTDGAAKAADRIAAVLLGPGTRG